MKFNYIGRLFKATESDDNNSDTLTFEFRNEEQNLETMIMDMFGNKNNSGNVIIDYDSSEPKLIPVRKNRDSYVSISIEGDIMTVHVDNASLDGKTSLADKIAEFVKDLGEYGNSGHSFSIKFYPTSNKAKTKSYGWDGDGSDRIVLDTIKVS